MSPASGWRVFVKGCLFVFTTRTFAGFVSRVSHSRCCGARSKSSGSVSAVCRFAASKFPSLAADITPYLGGAGAALCAATALAGHAGFTNIEAWYAAQLIATQLLSPPAAVCAESG